MASIVKLVGILVVLIPAVFGIPIFAEPFSGDGPSDTPPVVNKTEKQAGAGDASEKDKAKQEKNTQEIQAVEKEDAGKKRE